ncbi:hypothetical protein WME91_08550 [Sorangium sp. So ce269]
MRLTFLSDGVSDQALLAVIRWLLRERSTIAFQLEWADLRRLHRPPSRLADRVRKALDLYPCNLLVVHRDAEREPMEKRCEEILDATRNIHVPVVSLVPVRMQEAWFLFDEHAIRRASGCPNGRNPLNIPPMKDAETIPDPKETLFDALRAASNLSGRRLKQFHPDVRRLADLMDDFSPLRKLTAFRALENSLCNALLTLGLLRSEDDPSPEEET